MKTYFSTRQLLSILYLIVILGVTVIFIGLWQKGLYFTTIVPKTEWTETAVTRASKIYTDDQKNSKTQPEKETSYNQKPPCDGCRELIKNVLKDFSLNWTKNEENHWKLRTSLITNCNGFQKAFTTQTNSPLGTTLVYDMEKRTQTIRINEDLFKILPKEVQFSDKTLNTCAVVGNGGILANSHCGEAIDSAQFVIRCNLAPLSNDYSKHVGKKTSVVTANPSILSDRYGLLQDRRRAFVEHVSFYGDALLLLPAFSLTKFTEVCMRVLYTLEDFRSSVKTVFMNPDYITSADKFWRSQGLEPGRRMSTGFMMVSLALEICNNVDVYGFWPFDNHPYGFQSLTSHYYDDAKPNTGIHAMPAEFAHLIKLHNQGVLKLHLGDCLQP